MNSRDAAALAAQLDEIELYVRSLEQQAGAVEQRSVRDIQNPLYGLPTENDLDIMGLAAVPGVSHAMISWQPPPQVLVKFYEIQVSTNNDFTSYETFRTVDTRFQYRAPGA